MSIGARFARLPFARAHIIHIGVGVGASLSAGQDGLASGLAARRRLGFMNGVYDVLVGGGFTSRALVGGGLGGVAVGVGPVGQTAQTGLVADLAGDEGEDVVETVELAVELVIGVGDDVVLFVGGHHQVGEGVANTVKEEAAVFAFFGFGGLRKVLRG